MHELSIAQSLMTTIDTWRARNGRPRVLSACVEIGVLAGVDPELLRNAWKAACEAFSPEMRDCALILNLLPLKYHCAVCEKDFEAERPTPICPVCGGAYPRHSGGHELNLKHIEVE